jgi:Radical SAM superfamily
MSTSRPGRDIAARVAELLAGESDWLQRFRTISRLAATTRASEFHVTNACNLRCEGCWFFVFEHDTATKEVKNLDQLDAFLGDLKVSKRINAALVIGGEPTLVLDRLRLYRKHFRYLTISTNGLKPLPRAGFEDVAVGITLFGGGRLDDQLRAIKPNGARFSGLLDRALENYRDDPRAGFIYALNEDGIEYIEETVRKIRANGNRVQFNYYSAYGKDGGLSDRTQALLEEALRVKALFPDVVVSHPYYIRALITGDTHFGRFSYEVCPSISAEHPAHVDRLSNGNPTLTFFNSYAADLKTLNFCCTSGHCADCRDSQAVLSWILVSIHHFLHDPDSLKTWIEIAESYWTQFVWSPLHWARHSRSQVDGLDAETASA